MTKDDANRLEAGLTTTTSATATPATTGTRTRSKRWRMRADGALGVALLAFMLIAAIIGPMLWRLDPLVSHLPDAFLPPSFAHPCGTDQLGRDQLARILWGTRLSLMVVLGVGFVAATMGSLLGIIAGYFGGVIDAVLMRLIDIQLAIPFILLILLVIAIVGASVGNLILVLGITGWAVYARVARAKTMEVRELEYIEAANVMGLSRIRIIFRHVLPNIATPLWIVLTLDLPRLIVLEASVGFLGLGIQPPTPTLGNLIGDGRSFILVSQWLVFYPGVAVAILVVGFNLLGDALARRSTN